jgi:hypothetical protein
MGRFLRGNGKIAVTLFDMAITEHAEKYAAFESTLRKFYLEMNVVKPIEDHNLESEAYDKCHRLTIITTDLYPDLVREIRSGRWWRRSISARAHRGEWHSGTCTSFWRRERVRIRSRWRRIW